jgi:hypothetical protein
LCRRSRNWARIEGEHHTGALLTGGPLGSWDAAGASHARALVAAARDLRMFYSSPDAASGAWAIGAARSADGLTWKKTGACSVQRCRAAGSGVAALNVCVVDIR